jgi:dipeptidyl aminopeptidase/acylaminoacyl peptidase
MRSALLALLLLAVPALAQDGAPAYQTPPPELARLVDAPLPPSVSLSPDRRMMALFERPSLPAVADLAQPELGLAGVRINPRTNGPSRASGFTAFTLKAVEGGAERRVSGFPEGARFRSPAWSPDGAHAAVLVDRPAHVELWVVDVARAAARRLIEAPVNDAAPGAAMAWIDHAALVVRTVPAGRGAAPEEALAPAGPVVQESDGRAAPARTYQDLLRGPLDEQRFEHYMTSALMRVGLDGTARPVGGAALYVGAEPSPDGRFLLTEAVHAPYSYLVPWSRFARRSEVWDLATGARVAEVAAVPLQERVPIAFGSVPTGPRGVGWRADAPAMLTWVEALDGGDAGREAPLRDRLVALDAPFTGAPVTMAELPLRYAGVRWGSGTVALVEESWWSTRQRRVSVLNPSRPGTLRTLLEVSSEDRYNDPGRPMMTPSPSGASVLLLDGDDTFWTGAGASPEGSRPFVHRRSLATGETEELFRSAAPDYEQPMAFLDLHARRLLTMRERNDTPPNVFARDLAAGTATALTDFPHPYPELASIQKETVEYTRADGVPLSATLYLPAGYDAARDGPLPTLIWAYPREFRSAGAAGQRTDSPHQFTRVSYWGAVPFVTRGYAVLDDAAFPIVGEGDAEPNDAFREQLVLNAEAAIAEGVRRGVVDPERVAVGGHSYGAFMTANLLAHSNLFRTGIARSGAYNRTLTPFGFQSEERTYWQAPDLYTGMSPFMHADKIDEPILLIHGQADNNPGTFTLQSERLFGAIKGLGGTARLVLLPHESHGYQARESLLHMLWEQSEWLDRHVRDAPPRERAAAPASAPTGSGG